VRTKILFLLGCGFLVFGVLQYEKNLTPSYTVPAIAPAAGAEIIPNFSLPDLNQKPVQLSDKTNTVTLLHFWATWCTPCIAELPELAEFARQNKKNVAVIAISLDEKNTDIKPFLRQLLGSKQSHIIWLRDNNKNLSEDTLGVYKLPETLLINEQRVLKHKFVGAVNWLSPKIKAQVFALPFKL